VTALGTLGPANRWVELLRERRGPPGPQQTKLEVMACDLGVTRQAVASLLAGRIRPDVATAALAERVYGISVSTWLEAAEGSDRKLPVARNVVPTVEGDSTLPIPNATPWTKKALP
jgi:transcriptional regulator with XRE-family HTH domain